MVRMAWARGLSAGMLALFALNLAFASASASALAQTPSSDLAKLTPQIDSALSAVAAGDVQRVKSAFAAFDSQWPGIEDGIRDKSLAHYAAIETAMGDVKIALDASPPDAAGADRALRRLRSVCDAFIAGESVPGGTTTGASPTEPTFASVTGRLDSALAMIEKGDARGAAAEMNGFRAEWPLVELVVKGRSPTVYASTEDGMARAYGLLAQSTPDTATARSIIATMKTDLAPFADHHDYGIFDAAIILLREGLEALLIVGALFAFLKRTGNADKSIWIWAGGAAGLLASAVVAVVISIIFTSAVAGLNRELLEGVTGLVAAAMLLYMSFWLHSKSTMGAWRRYISETMGAALARGSLLSLALISFLAVFREGAETVLFYIGIAASISTLNLLLGIGIATAGLATVGVLIFVFGAHISVGPFFRVASILMYYLAFKFVGVGVHALQIADRVPSTTARIVPSIDFLGVYSTWETTSAQLILIVVAAAAILYDRRRKLARRESVASAPGAAA